MYRAKRSTKNHKPSDYAYYWDICDGTVLSAGNLAVKYQEPDGDSQYSLLSAVDCVTLSRDGLKSSGGQKLVNFHTCDFPVSETTLDFTSMPPS